MTAFRCKVEPLIWASNARSSVMVKKKWTEAEIQLVCSRYPSEGSNKLAKELDRTRQSVQMCAHKHGAAIDRSQYRTFSTGRRGSRAKTFRGYKRVSGTYFSRVLNRAKDAGLDCTVTIEYLDSIITDYCPLSGHKLVFPKYSDDARANASLDRIDSEVGYVPGNVQWVDKVVNIMKGDLEEKYLYEFCRDIVNTLRKRYES